MTMRVITGLTILEMLYYSPVDLSHLTFVYSLYFLFKIISILYFMKNFEPKADKYKNTFLYELLYSLTAFLFVFAAH